jgi:hypothetical protein
VDVMATYQIVSTIRDRLDGEIVGQKTDRVTTESKVEMSRKMAYDIVFTLHATETDSVSMTEL